MQGLDDLIRCQESISLPTAPNAPVSSITLWPSLKFDGVFNYGSVPPDLRMFLHTCMRNWFHLSFAGFGVYLLC